MARILIVTEDQELVERIFVGDYDLSESYNRQQLLDDVLQGIKVAKIKEEGE